MDERKSFGRALRMGAKSLIWQSFVETLRYLWITLLKAGSPCIVGPEKSRAWPLPAKFLTKGMLFKIKHLCALPDL
jgi:hypothetical protein